MIMKKQQWMFKVFSMINSSSSSSSISFNNVCRRRPFCSTTTTTNNKRTNTNCLSVAQTPSPPPVSNNKQFNMLLEKTLPLLIVPYDHITPKEYVLCPPRRSNLGDFHVCDGTLGFINLFHDDDDDDDDDDDQLIINKKKKKKKEVYDVYLPEIARRRICGSSEGWLVTAHQNGEFQLLNPVTRVIVHLPHFTALPTRCDFHIRDVFIHKVVTNTTTTNSTITLPAEEEANTEVVVMAIYGELHGSLAFCRTPLSSSSSTTTGNTTTTTTTTTTTDETAAAWIKIPVKIPVSAEILNLREIDEHDITYEVIDGISHWVTMFSWWVDVTFYKGNFYTVDPSGMVGVVKGLDGSSVPFVQFLRDGPDQSDYCSHLCYLVECGGDLLMVMRKETYQGQTKEEEEETKEEEEICKRPYRTNGFRVLKLDLNNGPSWGKEEEITDLGEDCALFVGYNHSFSFSASKIPGCRGNCIYFTDNHQEGNSSFPNGGHDIGVYNLEDASFEKLNYETCSSQLIMPPPVWYVPNYF